MSERKWTEGPWVVDADAVEHCCHESAVCANVPSGKGMYGSDVAIICEVWGSDNFKNNANIIAAAPDLYDALEAAVLSQPNDDSCEAWVSDARAALKEAGQ